MALRLVYTFDSYKEFLADCLQGEGRRGQLTRAAEALGCQPSFLSRVIGSEIHLTPDQAFALCGFWGLDPEQSEYFQTLVEKDRASRPEYRAHLTKKLTQMRRAQADLRKQTKMSDFSQAEQQAKYFSTWIYSALHFLVSCPATQTTTSLAQRLFLPKSVVENMLREMEQMGFVTHKAGRWSYASGQFHLPRHSPFVLQHHQNWRTRALLDAQQLNESSIHYTSVRGLSEADGERLRQMLVDFIGRAHRLAEPSDPEEVLVFTCDLFAP